MDGTETSSGRSTAAPATRRRLLGQTELVAIILMGTLLSQRWLIDLLDFRPLQAWSTMFVAIVVQALPFLVGGVLLASFISVLLSERVLAAVVPKRSGLAVPVAGLSGMALPGCECASVPISGSLIRRGVPPAAALTFLLSAPAINPIVLVSTAVAFPGQPEMVLARFVASLSVALVMGWLWLTLGGKVPMRLPKLPPDAGQPKLVRFLGSAQHDFLHAGGFLVLGAMIAASINVLVPRQVVDSVAESFWLGILVMALFAFLIAICSEADAFVAASMSSFSPTAQLAFMVVGPAIDVKLAAMQSGTFGRAFAVRFAPLTFAVAVISAVLVGWWLL
ncbi:permease [Nocardioides limicola]|uniref:permease n=1 Tax=Nocardioides limicola TaxID=2803368 RepID=UPI00193BA2F3|nr:permease [Nocardioides sp. DJM-14]